MYIIHFIMLLLLFDLAELARKVKRKENYILNVPLPPKSTAQHSHTSHPSHPSHPPHPHNHKPVPYEFEEIHQGEEYLAAHMPHLKNVNYHQLHQQYESLQVKNGNNFLNDNGLRSLAKGSADQANSAVASQNAAGKQAAYVAKSTLAQAATQAAGTAVAVLKGKEVLLQRLEEQTADAHKVVENELTQLQQAKRSAKSAQYAAQQAINHVAVLTAALNNAQAASELAQKAASEAASELSSQIDMVAQAKQKLEAVESSLYSARLDFEETKEAAEKATLSAQEAQLNANDAAVHANVELHDSVHAIHESGAETVKRAIKRHSGR